MQGKVFAMKVGMFAIGFLVAYSWQVKKVEEAKQNSFAISQRAEGVKMENELIKSTLVDYRLSCVKAERF